MDDVRGAAHPDGAVGLQDALAGGEPGAVEFVVRVRAARAVPLALVDAHHASGVAGDAVVGKEIRRVGEDQVHAVFGNGREDFQTIALIDLDVVFGVVKDRGRELGVGSRESGLGIRHFCHIRRWDAVAAVALTVGGSGMSAAGTFESPLQ